MIDEIVRKYLEKYPDERKELGLLLDQLAAGEKLDDRRNFNGHIAGDAVILSPDKNKLLLIYHKQFKCWNQPGGHLDPGEAGPWLTAEREAMEETGLKNLMRVSLNDDLRVPLHIACGRVPASKPKNEPEHWHHDFRYGFIAATEELPEITDSGIGGVKWVPLKDYKKEGGHDYYISVHRFEELTRLKA